MSSRPRPVPGIARGPQAFTPAARTQIANPMSPPILQPEEADDQSDLAMEIYCRVVAQFIAAGRTSEFTNLAHLAKIAAQAYFQESSTDGQEETSSQTQG